MEKIRLAKRIAESGIASRREAERLIKSGQVMVDKVLITTPVFFVNEASTITVNQKNIQPKSKKMKLWKFHKPAGVITSKRDSKGRPTVFDFFSSNNFDSLEQDRLLYIGRLDCNSEGLLLFTNNGNVARLMELPDTALQRTYKVRIFGRLSEDAKEQICRGVIFNGVTYGPARIIEEKSTGNRETSKNRWIKIILTEGKNREVRKIMEHFGCKVNRLIRTDYGPFSLGNLPPGKIERVDSYEVEHFFKSIASHFKEPLIKKRPTDCAAFDRE